MKHLLLLLILSQAAHAADCPERSKSASVQQLLSSAASGRIYEYIGYAADNAERDIHELQCEMKRLVDLSKESSERIAELEREVHCLKSGIAFDDCIRAEKEAQKIILMHEILFEACQRAVSLKDTCEKYMRLSKESGKTPAADAAAHAADAALKTLALELLDRLCEMKELEGGDGE